MIEQTVTDTKYHSLYISGHTGHPIVEARGRLCYLSVAVSLGLILSMPIM